MQLERVSSVRQVSTTVKDKRRRRIIDAVLCFGVPAIYMALRTSFHVHMLRQQPDFLLSDYIVQGHRFDIVEDFGCRPNTYVSIPSVILIWIPPAFFSVSAAILASTFVSFVDNFSGLLALFTGFALHHFLVRRITFARHLQNSNSALTPSRYFRLMSMALVQIFWGIFVTAVNMWFTMKGGLRPWTNWVDVHWDFSRVSQFPALFIPPTYWLYTYLLWWTIPISSILFWGFFSFGEDAMREYRACLSWIKRHIFRRPENSSKTNIVNVSLPSLYVAVYAYTIYRLIVLFLVAEVLILRCPPSRITHLRVTRLLLIKTFLRHRCDALTRHRVTYLITRHIRQQNLICPLHRQRLTLLYAPCPKNWETMTMMSKIPSPFARIHRRLVTIYRQLYLLRLHDHSFTHSPASQSKFKPIRLRI